MACMWCSMFGSCVTMAVLACAGPSWPHTLGFVFPGSWRARGARSQRLAGGGGGLRGCWSVGIPQYVPQSDPHDALIILNIHKWGDIFFQKEFSIRQQRGDKSKQNWLLPAGAHFLNPPFPPHNPGLNSPPPPPPTPAEQTSGRWTSIRSGCSVRIRLWPRLPRDCHRLLSILPTRGASVECPVN